MPIAIILAASLFLSAVVSGKFPTENSLVLKDFKLFSIKKFPFVFIPACCFSKKTFPFSDMHSSFSVSKNDRWVGGYGSIEDAKASEGERRKSPHHQNSSPLDDGSGFIPNGGLHSANGFNSILECNFMAQLGDDRDQCIYPLNTVME